jgi:uncharacterized membrane protein
MTPLHRIALFAVAAALVAVVAAPLFRFAGAEAVAGAIYGLFAHVCHQDPHRSVSVLNFDLAVCGRCTGLYVGLLLALVASRFVRGAHRWLATVALLLAPLWIVADVGFAWLGWHEPSLLTRMLSGLVLGAGAALAIAHARSAGFAASLGLQVGALILVVIPLLACKKPVKKGEAPPAAAAPVAPVATPEAPPQLHLEPGCASDTDCKGERVCVDGKCVDRDVPIILKLPEGGCVRDTDCKGERVCVEGQCQEPATSRPATTAVEVKPVTRCEDCPGRCLAVQQLCNEGSVRDCFLAGACICTCKKDAGGCGSTLAELDHCVETNRAKAGDED